ncbi:MAG: 2-oxo acid dehydrogenase subunit E2 [Deltaproteobacteria bacterium]|nr:2-oxo acid dehydrogenase subunit E2 [Deltaproteobacteria bacterium]
MPNIDLEAQDRVSAFRRVAIGTWRTTHDPQIYGGLTLRMEEALRYIEAFREATGKRLTVTHLVGKAVAMALAEVPGANVLLRFNRPYRRRRVHVFFSVMLPKGDGGDADLSGVRLEDVDRKSLVELVDELDTHLLRVRSGKDEVLERSRSAFSRIPYPLLNAAIDFISLACYGLNLDLSRLGIPNDPFGSVVVTNIGSLGLDEGYAPLIPYCRAPILVAVGAVGDTPVVQNGKVRPAKTMRVQATLDHRLIDGAHAAALARVLRAWLEQPFQHFDALGTPSRPVTRIR